MGLVATLKSVISNKDTVLELNQLPTGLVVYTVVPKDKPRINIYVVGDSMHMSLVHDDGKVTPTLVRARSYEGKSILRLVEEHFFKTHDYFLAFLENREKPVPAKKPCEQEQAPKQERTEEVSALRRFMASGGYEEDDPLERLRFFCSFAMSGDDWLDVEEFFDGVKEDREREAAKVYLFRRKGTDNYVTCTREAYLSMQGQKKSFETKVLYEAMPNEAQVREVIKSQIPQSDEFSEVLISHLWDLYLRVTAVKNEDKQ